MEVLKELIGKTLSSIEVNKDKTEMDFICSEGSRYKMYHYQDCCESVSVDDIVGDLFDLIGSPILQADEVNSDDNPEIDSEPKSTDTYCDDSRTWTFYHFATIKGYVTIKWLGTSNGYYSESVDFVKID